LTILGCLAIGLAAALWTATLSGNLQLTGTVKSTLGVAGGNDGYQVQPGQNSFPYVNPQATQAAASGLVGQCTKEYQVQLVIANGGSNNLDLQALSGGSGNCTSFSNLKFILAQILSPDGTKTVKLGPQSVSNAFVGPFDAATDGLSFTSSLMIDNTLSSAGYTVDGSHHYLGLSNPSATSLTVQILLWGN
jgi:hypothetical protein